MSVTFTVEELFAYLGAVVVCLVPIALLLLFFLFYKIERR